MSFGGCIEIKLWSCGSVGIKRQNETLITKMTNSKAVVLTVIKKIYDKLDCKTKAVVEIKCAEKIKIE